MRNLPKVRASAGKEDLIKQVDEVHRAIVDFFRDLPKEKLESPAEPDGWTVAKNMRHVASTLGSFSFWIGMPAFLIRLRGRPSRKQPGLDELRPTNRHGITDYGRYPQDTLANEALKNRLIEQILGGSEKLQKAVGRRTEEELDGLSGPFGGMSLRTFVHFLIKHNLHHTGVVRSRFESR